VEPSGLAGDWSSRRQQACERQAARVAPPQLPQDAACVTSSWWIRVPWLIRGTPVPVINHEARINHANWKHEEQEEQGEQGEHEEQGEQGE
jgi:hypothetical protein